MAYTRSCIAVLALTSLLLAGAAGAQDKTKTEVFFTKMNEDLIVLTHGDLMPMGTIPSNVMRFDEPKIRAGAAAMHKMRDKTGTVVGFGSQMEDVPVGPDGKLLPDWHTAWTLILPGRGILFLHEYEKTGPVQEAMAAVRKTGKLDAPIIHQSTAGPLPSGHGVIVGGTGEFAGKTGTFVEIDKFTELDPGPMGVKGEVELRITFTN